MAAPAATFAMKSCLMEQIAAKGVSGFAASLHNAIVAPYILHYGSEEQKRKLAAAAWRPANSSAPSP